ncbi:MAG: hypothetical protein OQL18_11815 [Deltaproteobacteria bacterium]|nr:hypothetical protein [Deltaproteobacteria bacterium]
MEGFWGYHSEWNLGSPGGWDYQRITQEIGKAVWARVNKLTPIGIEVDFDHPLLYPIDGFVKMLVANHQLHTGSNHGLIAVIAEEETLVDVTENINLANRLNCIDGLSSALMAPHELELQKGRVSYRGTPVSIAFVDFNTDVLLNLHRQHNLKPLLQLVAEGRVVNPRGTEPINVKSMFELLTSEGKERFSPQSVLRTPWTRRFLPGKTLGQNGEQIDDLYEWTRRNWDNLVLKPERGYSGMGVRVGVVNPDADEAVGLALEKGQYIVQQKIPLHLWAEECVSYEQSRGVLLERVQTDFRCLFGADGLYGFLVRYGGVPTNVGSGGGVQPLAILKSDIPVGEAVKQINDAMLQIEADELRDVLEMQQQLAIDHRFTYLLGPIKMALRPRLITLSHLAALKNYTEAVWSDCLILEKMYLEGALDDMTDIEDEELTICQSQPWGGAAAIFATDGLFSFGAHPEGQ